MTRGEFLTTFRAADAAWRQHVRTCGDCQPDTGPDTYCTDGRQIYLRYAAIQDEYLTHTHG